MIDVWSLSKFRRGVLLIFKEVQYLEGPVEEKDDYIISFVDYNLYYGKFPSVVSDV